MERSSSRVRAWSGRVLGIVLGTGCAGSDGPPTLLDDPMAAFPDAFDDVGLFPRAPDWDVVPERAHAYRPAHELWSDGLFKARHVVVPEGEVVSRSRQGFDYPAGTLFFKTFFVGDDDDRAPVETRLLRHVGDDEWDYAVYAWDGEVATWLDITEPVPVQAGETPHTIPAELDCRSCHESSTSFVLGWTDVQLVDAAPALFEAGVLADPPPEDAPRIEHDDERTRRVLEVFYGNCVHCHNGTTGPSSSFDLRPDVALANVIGVETDSSATAAGIRVVPGDPAASILFQGVSGETDDPEVKAMPPVGVDVVDASMVALLREWIADLPDGDAR